MIDLFLRNKEIDTAKKAVKQQPDNLLYQEILGDLYYKYKYFQESITTYEKILKKDDSYLPVLMKVSKCYLERKNFLKAFRTLKHLYKINPKDSFAKDKLYSLKDIECSLEVKIIILKGLMSIFENDESIIELLAQTYLKDGQFSNSIILYEKLCNFNEKERFLRALSLIFNKLKNYEKEIECLEKLLLKNNLSDEEIKTLAFCYANVGRLDEAKGVYEILIEKNPNKKGELKKEISKILLLENQHDNAIVVSKEALLENEFDFQAKLIIAQAYIEKKELKKAIDFLQDFYFDPLNEKEQNQILDMFINTTIEYSKELAENKDYENAIDILIPALRYREKESKIYYHLADISEKIKDFTSQKDYLKTAKEYEKSNN